MNNLYFTFIEGMESVVLAPNSELSPFIEKYVFFECRNVQTDIDFKLVSNGKVELLVVFNKDYILVKNDSQISHYSNCIFGISCLSNSIEFRVVSKKSCFKGVSVIFHFRGVYDLLNLELKSITNRVVCFETVLGISVDMLVKNISNAICSKSIENILNKFFMILMKRDVFNNYSFLIRNRVKNNFLSILNMIIKKNGNCTVNSLSKDFNQSSRTIHRMFICNIGLSPKDYMKIIRFNHACNIMTAFPEKDWFDIICSCGYYDQMHFIHEFKSVMKYPPMKFLRKNSTLKSRVI
ncbi:MAG: helix-turn-helix transcriptional regulator [Bacteroidetes bacterium]|nr:helix-turn-helix transcriptional regulator [Bacteroidota bacterium]